MSYRIFVFLCVLIFLTSCSYKKSAADGSPPPPSPPTDPSKLSLPKSTPPQNPPGNSPGGLEPLPTPPPMNVRPLKVGFVQTRITVDSKNEAHVELGLSEPAKKPVIVEVYLQNGSAIYHRDFSGFKLHSASVIAETRQIVIFAPKKRYIRLPPIGVRNTNNCDSEFYIKINKNNLKEAGVDNPVAKISIPCN